MAEALQPTVHLAWDPVTVTIVKPVKSVLYGLAPFRNMEILVCDQFRDGEAVVDFHHADFFPWISDTGLFVRSEAALVRSHKMVPVPTVESHLFAAAEGQLERLDRDKILPAHLFGFFNCGNYGASRSVTHTAAIKES